MNLPPSQEIYAILGQMMKLIYNNQIPKEQSLKIIKKAKEAKDIQLLELSLLKRDASEEEMQDFYSKMLKVISEAKSILNEYAD